MGVLQRFSRLVSGGSEAEAKLDAVTALNQCYIDCLHRSQLLAHHAEMAPQQAAADALRELATAESGQAERLREALRAAGATPPTVSAFEPTGGALNHWARLVQDLQLHREAVRHLRELAVRFAETLPATATLFGQLCDEDAVHAERLRTLIARADPQALD